MSELEIIEALQLKIELIVKRAMEIANGRRNR